MSTESREIIDRLRLKMPLVVTLPDPLSGEPFSVNRDNLLALLVVDVGNLVLESQINAALYMEAARIHAAAWRAHEESEIRLRKWKADKRNKERSQAKKAEEKKPTKEELEDAYRDDPEYVERYNETVNLATLVFLAADLKKAFELKSREIENLCRETRGHNRVQDNGDRISEMEIEKMSREAAEAAADFVEQSEPKAKTETEPAEQPSKRRLRRPRNVEGE